MKKTRQKTVSVNILLCPKNCCINFLTEIITLGVIFRRWQKLFTWPGHLDSAYYVARNEDNEKKKVREYTSTYQAIVLTASIESDLARVSGVSLHNLFVSFLLFCLFIWVNAWHNFFVKVLGDTKKKQGKTTTTYISKAERNGEPSRENVLGVLVCKASLSAHPQSKIKTNQANKQVNRSDYRKFPKHFHVHITIMFLWDKSLCFNIIVLLWWKTLINRRKRQ